MAKHCRCFNEHSQQEKVKRDLMYAAEQTRYGKASIINLYTG